MVMSTGAAVPTQLTWEAALDGPPARRYAAFWAYRFNEAASGYLQLVRKLPPGQQRDFVRRLAVRKLAHAREILAIMPVPGMTARPRRLSRDDTEYLMNVVFSCADPGAVPFSYLMKRELASRRSCRSIAASCEGDVKWLFEQVEAMLNSDLDYLAYVIGAASTEAS
jgi:hypothetical protein